MRVLWRGGRRRKASARPQTNGSSDNQDVIVIDDSDDEQAEAQKSAQEDAYEEEEDEQDPDCPYSNIISDLDIGLESAALHLAIPAPPPSKPPKLIKSYAILVVACANGSIVVLTIPLSPPADNGDTPEGLSQIDLSSLSQPAHGLSAKLLTSDDGRTAQGRSNSRGPKPEAELLIAAASSTLNVWSLDVGATAVKKRRSSLVASVNLATRGSSISFHPSSRSTQLLLSDAAGAVRIYDALALETADGQPTGQWLMSYLSPFNASATSSYALARRKRVLGCAWVLGGRGILALLEDGEWGIWETSGPPQPGKGVEEFAMSGFIGSTSGEVAEPARSKKQSKLAPMTPNTRKTKSENLFGNTSKTSSAIATGGMRVNHIPAKSGQQDESVVIWYCGEIYSISSLQTFWQRSTSNSGSFGSLYAPGMAHIPDVNLCNESITSVSQLGNHTQQSAFGQVNAQRDLVISAEHRLIVTHTARPPVPTRQLFQQANERPVSQDRDQRMLDAGDLDLGGLNRVLDSRTEDTRPRRVGFAH